MKVCWPFPVSMCAGAGGGGTGFDLKRPENKIRVTVTRREKTT
tara:strand:+ start:370 stop:498 length:129 start_codon:yes stop_codon:yes gene_type:complete